VDRRAAGRAGRRAGGALAGPWLLAWTALLIVAALPLQDYGHRLWGSLHECLVFWPLLALGWTRWARSWSVAGGALLGVLLGVATVFSYLHAVTAVVLAGLTLVEGRRAAVQGLLACTLAASLVFGLWTQGVTYEQDTHLTVRDGWQLSEVARWLLLPRLDRVALEAVGTWHGPHRGPTTWSALSAVGLWILALGSAARGLRSQEGRVLAAGVVAGLLAAAVGSGFAGPPEGLRYHLPLLAALLAALASGGPRVALAGVVLAAGLHTATSRHPVERTGEAWLGLGAFTLLRLHGEPHRKFLAMLPHVPEAQRPIFAFGYGLDVGRELCPDPPPGIQSLLDPSVAWTFWPDDRAPELRWSYLLGLGAGLPEGCRLRDLPPAVSAPVQAGRGGTGVGLDRWLLDHAASIPR
jgi:hypothetical protein